MMKISRGLVMAISLLFLVACEKSDPVACPTIDPPDKFFPVKGDEYYKLDTGGVKPGDGFVIAPSEKQNSPFFENDVYCHEGKEAGENVNQIYCDQLMMQKLITNEQGDIIEEKLIGVGFVFDKNQQLVTTECFT